MKKVLCLVLVLVMLLSSVPAFAEGEITVMVNGEVVKCDVEPYIKNGRTMVQIGEITYALGVKSDWNNDTITATFVKGDITVTMKRGEIFFYKNGEKFDLDVPSEINNSRLMVPVRALSEAFDCVVNWNNYNRRVEIFTEDAKDKHWYFYDENDRLVYKMHGSGGWERFEYDANGNKTASRSHIGDVEYTYDEEGRIILEVSSIGFIVETTYDEKGNRIKRRSINERFNHDDTEEYTYNEKGQIVTRKTDVITYTYIYDEAGNKIETKFDIGGSDKYTYDERGNLIEENRKNGEWIKYTYDAMDNRTSITYSSGKWEKYEYDDQGKVIREEWSDGMVKTSAYDENGNRIFVSYTGGTLDGECYRYEYNEKGQVTYYEVTTILPYEYYIYKGKAYINKYTGNQENVAIPDEIENCPVVEIKPAAFVEKRFEKVVIGKNVSLIWHEAFYNCDIKELVFLNADTSITREGLETYITGHGQEKQMYVNSSFCRTPIGVIYGYQGSDAEAFAKEEGITFIVFEE